MQALLVLMTIPTSSAKTQETAVQRGVRRAGHLERAEDAGICGGDGHLGARALLRRADSATAGGRGLCCASATSTDRHECAPLPGAPGLGPEPARTRQTTGRLGIAGYAHVDPKARQRGGVREGGGREVRVCCAAPSRGPAAHPLCLPERPVRCSAAPLCAGHPSLR